MNRRTLTYASLLDSFRLITSVILILSMLAGCSPRPRTEDLEAVEYTPLLRDDWKVSTPAEQGLDPMLVAELYYNAAKLPRLYGLLYLVMPAASWLGDLLLEGVLEQLIALGG